MDAAIAQALSERLGLRPDELQALQAGNPAALVATRLAEEGADPLLSMLLTSTLATGQPETTPTDERDTLPERLASAGRTIEALRRHLADADAMIAHVAEAFGACSVCWGTSPLCERCHGQGGPGNAIPREDELLAWAVPALRRIGLQVVTGATPTDESYGALERAPAGKGGGK